MTRGETDKNGELTCFYFEREPDYKLETSRKEKIWKT